MGIIRKKRDPEFHFFGAKSRRIFKIGKNTRNNTHNPEKNVRQILPPSLITPKNPEKYFPKTGSLNDLACGSKGSQFKCAGKLMDQQTYDWCLGCY